MKPSLVLTTDDARELLAELEAYPHCDLLASLRRRSHGIVLEAPTGHRELWHRGLLTSEDPKAEVTPCGHAILKASRRGFEAR